MIDDKIKTGFFDIPRTNDKFHQARPLEKVPLKMMKDVSFPLKWATFLKFNKRKMLTKFNM